MSEWSDLRDRAEALVEQGALDPVTIARTLHHLSMLGLELTAFIGDTDTGLLAKASEAELDYDARRAKMIDDLLGGGFTLTRARERASHSLREFRREAEQSKLAADYAKGVLASVNRRHFELMNVGKHVDAAIGGRRG
ncbi:hypothetical protein [Microbacterium gubbeenense]|uniref:hypothetical protein n=1 Tax=Microbacterium gubbeenense TaxID=159896 RepID=UPI0004037AD4|nr:hypothetical protein [Microbacterium gubbeenense]